MLEALGVFVVLKLAISAVCVILAVPRRQPRLHYQSCHVITTIRATIRIKPNRSSRKRVVQHRDAAALQDLLNRLPLAT